MTAPTYAEVAAALNRISLDAQWDAAAAEAWCREHRASPAQCIRLIRATAGRLSEMARAASAGEGADDGQL